MTWEHKEILQDKNIIKRPLILRRKIQVKPPEEETKENQKEFLEKDEEFEYEERKITHYKMISWADNMAIDVDKDSE